MSNHIHIELNDQAASMVMQESEALGVSPEEYANRTLTRQALRDQLQRAQQEEGGKPADEVFDRLEKKYRAMSDQ